MIFDDAIKKYATSSFLITFLSNSLDAYTDSTFHAGKSTVGDFKSPFFLYINLTFNKTNFRLKY